MGAITNLLSRSSIPWSILQKALFLGSRWGGGQEPRWGQDQGWGGEVEEKGGGGYVEKKGEGEKLSRTRMMRRRRWRKRRRTMSVSHCPQSLVHAQSRAAKSYLSTPYLTATSPLLLLHFYSSIFFLLFFMRPESDHHCLALSVTHSLTNYLMLLRLELAGKCQFWICCWC